LQLVAVALAFAGQGWQAVPHDVTVLVSRQTPSGQLYLPFEQTPLQERALSMQASLQSC
jgi:hypothetical protein